MTRVERSEPVLRPGRRATAGRSARAAGRGGVSAAPRPASIPITIEIVHDLLERERMRGEEAELPGNVGAITTLPESSPPA